MKNSHKFWVTIFCLTSIIGSFLSEIVLSFFLGLQIGFFILTIILFSFGDFEDIIEDAKTNGILWIITYFNLLSLIIIPINKFNKWIDGEI